MCVCVTSRFGYRPQIDKTLPLLWREEPQSAQFEDKSRTLPPGKDSLRFNSFTDDGGETIVHIAASCVHGQRGPAPKESRVHVKKRYFPFVNYNCLFDK